MKALWLLLLGLGIPLLSPGQLFEYKTDTGWGLIDSSGKVVLPAAYDHLVPSGDRSYFFLQEKGLTGLFRENAGILLPVSYHRIFPADFNRFYVVRYGKYGVADSAGVLGIETAYDEIRHLTGDVYALRGDSLWGAGRLYGRLNIPCEFISVVLFKGAGEDFLQAQKADSSLSLYRLTGDLFLKEAPGEIISALGSTTADLALLYRKRGKLGILKPDGHALTPAIYDSIVQVDSLFMVAQNPYWGLLDRQGKTVLPVQYGELHQEKKGPWWIQKDRLWGLCSPKGQMLIPPRFTAKVDFEGPVARVRENDLYGLINLAGKEIVPAQYLGVQVFKGAARLKTKEGIDQLAFDEEGNLSNRIVLIVSGGTSYDRELDIGKLTGDSISLQSGRSGLPSFRANYPYVFDLPQSNITIARRVSGNYVMLNSLTGAQLRNSGEFAYIYAEDFLKVPAARAQAMDGKWGLIDTAGIFIPKPGVTYIGPFNDEMARVRINGRRVTPGTDSRILEDQFLKEKASWGIIHPDGNFVKNSPGQLQYIGDFHHGIAPFKKADRWGMIDTAMKQIIPPGLDGLSDPGPETDLLIYWKNIPKYLVFDENGKHIRSYTMSLDLDSSLTVIEELRGFHQGLAAAKSGGKWGFIDHTGDFVIYPQFDEVGDFEEGLAAVSLKRNWGFISPNGQLIVKDRFKQVRNFKEGRAAVKGNKGWGFIDGKGNWLLKAKYREVRDFENGYALVKDRKWGAINLLGKWAVKPVFSQIEMIGGYFRVREQGLYGYLSLDGDPAIPMNYTWLGEWREDKISFLRDSKYGFMNARQEEIISPAFDRATHFSEDLAPVSQNRKWGFVNVQGEWAIPAKYESVFPFSHGLAVVTLRSEKNDYLWGAIDKNGQIRIPIEQKALSRGEQGWLLAQTNDGYQYYDTLGVPSQLTELKKADPFESDYAIISKEGKQQLINPYLYSPVPDCYISRSLPGDHRIVVESDKQFGLINRKGEKVFHAQYDHIEFVDNIFRIFLDGKTGYLDKNARWILPIQP